MRRSRATLTAVALAAVLGAEAWSRVVGIDGRVIADRVPPRLAQTQQSCYQPQGSRPTFRGMVER